MTRFIYYRRPVNQRLIKISENNGMINDDRLTSLLQTTKLDQFLVIICKTIKL